jgi:hypothetical protein
MPKNTFFIAVQERGDHWRNELSGKVQIAHARNAIATNAAFHDEYKMNQCSRVPQEARRLFQV